MVSNRRSHHEAALSRNILWGSGFGNATTSCALTSNAAPWVSRNLIPGPGLVHEPLRPMASDPDRRLRPRFLAGRERASRRDRMNGRSMHHNAHTAIANHTQNGVDLSSSDCSLIVPCLIVTINRLGVELGVAPAGCQSDICASCSEVVP